jgi:carbonic anhydrase
MPRDLVERLRKFHTHSFPQFEQQYRELVAKGQHPTTLFIGCSDSRLVPHLLMDCGPGELFIVRNVGNLVPPYDASYGYHGTAAAIEFAVLTLGVTDIVVCGHSHCGAIQALYRDLPAEARHTRQWLELAREAVLPVTESEGALRRVEQRSVVLQLERLMTFPMVCTRVEAGSIHLHGWHYIIEDGRVLALDLESSGFVPIESAMPPLVSERLGIDTPPL